eukprot:351929-Chlamydomonas_euryale.AAC.2
MPNSWTQVGEAKPNSRTQGGKAMPNSRTQGGEAMAIRSACLCMAMAMGQVAVGCIISNGLGGSRLPNEKWVRWQ